MSTTWGKVKRDAESGGNINVIFYLAIDRTCSRLPESWLLYKDLWSHVFEMQ